MRAVLMLLVLYVSVVEAQEITREQAERIVQPVIRSDEENMAVQQAKWLKSQRAWIDSLLVRWDQYSAECRQMKRVKHDRADEVAKIVGAGKGFVEVFSDSISVYQIGRENREWTIARYYWTHRKPTLEGFMDFLRHKR